MFKSVYLPDSDDFILDSNTCQAFRSPNIDSAVWICNYEQTLIEFAPDQILDILTSVLLANPCSYFAGMDIEFRSGQKYILIQGTDPNVAEITDGLGAGTWVSTSSSKRDVNRVAADGSKAAKSQILTTAQGCSTP